MHPAMPTVSHLDVEPTEASQATRITADELIALSTPDRVKYLRLNRLPDGQLVLANVDGWAVLSKERREELRVKIKDAADILHKQDTGAVDADQLTALLGQVQQDESEVPDEQNERELRTRVTVSPVPLSEEQAAWHDQLVKEGGRPLFSRDRIEEISSNPQRYHSLLRPWATDPDDPRPEEDWQVFWKQVESWHDFRRWQRDNRSYGDFDEDKEFSIYVEEWAIRDRIMARISDANDPGIQKRARSMWDHGGRRERLSKRRYEWETKSGRTFAGYAEAARQRLAKHGFVHPFRFQEDAELQDTWTTWVEYIEYHCWWLDSDLAMVERLQARHDAAWKKVEESGVLREGETAESVATGDASWNRLMEATRVAEALDRGVKLLDSDPPAAHSGSAKSAEALLEELDRRMNILKEFCNKTAPYRERTTRIRHRRVLIPLLMEIASEIWDEEKEKRGSAASAEASEVPTSTEGQKKRARSGSDGQDVELPETKKTKLNRGSHSADQPQTGAGSEQAAASRPRDRGAWMTSLRKRPSRAEGAQETQQARQPSKTPRPPRVRQLAAQTQGSKTDAAGTRQSKTPAGPRPQPRDSKSAGARRKAKGKKKGGR